ncbi:MAG: hypothetical protein LBV12_11835 [Puniceicoccales bacterium]|jgi:hypothetical protein|nr:hypothetical protein [Puniceicoccales bacterium]
MSLSHYQTVFIDLLAILLEYADMQPADGRGRVEVIKESVIKASDKFGMDIDEEHNSVYKCIAQLLIKALGAEGREGEIDNAIQDARETAVKSIRSASYRICDHNGDASELIREFIANQNQVRLMFKIQGRYAHIGYAFFKLPYNEHIDLIYGMDLDQHQLPLYPHRDMKYLGFYSKATDKAYALLDPLRSLYWLHDKYPPECEDTMFGNLEKVLQQEISRRIQDMAKGGENAVDLTQISGLLSSLQEEYEKGLRDFADTVVIGRYEYHQDDLVRYIDDPDTLISEKAERYIKDHKEQLLRRWALHRALGQLADAADQKRGEAGV